MNSPDLNLLQNALAQFFTQNPIFCHKVNAERISILLWIGNNSKENPTYILKIANQKFLGLPRIDKNGQTYWKFKEWGEELEEKEKSSNNPSSPTNSSVPEIKQPIEAENSPSSEVNPSVNSEAIAKFQQRIKKSQERQSLTIFYFASSDKRYPRSHLSKNKFYIILHSYIWMNYNHKTNPKMNERTIRRWNETPPYYKIRTQTLWFNSYSTWHKLLLSKKWQILFSKKQGKKLVS